MAILFALIFGFNAYAGQTVRLFENNGSPVPDYDQIAARLSSEIVVFGNQKRFQISGGPWSGSSTLIYKVYILPDTHKHYALRIPLTSGHWQGDPSQPLNSKFIDMTINASEEIQQIVRVPKLYSFLHSQYALVEFLKFDFTFDQFLQTPEEIDDLMRERALKALGKFADGVAEFSELKDFRQANIAYDDSLGEWIFIDPMAGNRRFPIVPTSEELSSTPFDRDRELYTSPGWASSIFDMLRSRVLARRDEIVGRSCRALSLPAL